MPAFLAEIPYPVIDPEAFNVFGFGVRWYGIAYIVAFALAAWVLHGLSKRGRWPVHPDRVLDVLFWGIVGVWVGGRVGYMLFYADDKSPSEWLNFRQGGMSFHGGMGGVILAYFIYALKHRIPFRHLGDGLALATAPGIAVVRLANFVNAELWGRPWDGPWAMRFPVYHIEKPWDGAWDVVLRHPSQLYQMLGEGLALFLVMRWAMLKKGWGGGRIGCIFLFGYGAFRFVAEFFREPDKGLGFDVLGLTRGQEFCAAMMVVGLVAFALLRRSEPMRTIDWSKGTEPPASAFPGRTGS
jgi:phosphatidylglycerol:prolipoprotein diacylglycerol transferase